MTVDCCYHQNIQLVHNISWCVCFDFTMTIQRNCFNLCAVAIGTYKCGAGHIHIFSDSKERKKKGLLLHSELHFTSLTEMLKKILYLLFNWTTKNGRNSQKNTSQCSTFKLWKLKQISKISIRSWLKIQQEKVKLIQLTVILSPLQYVAPELSADL